MGFLDARRAAANVQALLRLPARSSEGALYGGLAQWSLTTQHDEDRPHVTIVSHRYRYIFLATRKTASTSTEVSLARSLGREDLIDITRELNPIDHPSFRSGGPVTRLRWAETLLKRVVARSGRYPALRLGKHASASQVAAVVGNEVWDSYTTICVERNPWDRIVSWWRWRTRHRPDDVPFDRFLRAIETSEPTEMKACNVGPWSNWPIYTIDGRVAVDHAIDYAHLVPDLKSALAATGLDWDGWLPTMKEGTRIHRSGAIDLRPDQIARIAALFPREIEHFGFEPPR